MSRRQATCSHCGELPHWPSPNPTSYVNCGGPHPSDSSTCSSYLYEKTALGIQVAGKLTIQSDYQCANAILYHDGLSYSNILNRGPGPSRRGYRVRFSLSLSSPASSSAASELISPKKASFIDLRLSGPLPLLTDLLLLPLPLLWRRAAFWMIALIFLIPHRFPAT